MIFSIEEMAIAPFEYVNFFIVDVGITSHVTITVMTSERQSPEKWIGAGVWIISAYIDGPLFCEYSQ